MARQAKKSGKSVDTVAVLLFKPGKMDAPLKPGLTRETEFGDLPDGSAPGFVKDERVDQARIGKKWNVQIPKVITIHKPGSDGAIVAETHTTSEIEVEFMFTVGESVPVDSIPPQIMQQLYTLQTQKQLQLQFAKVAGAAEVEETAPDGEEEILPPYDPEAEV